jgi:hypothetical protein
MKNIVDVRNGIERKSYPSSVLLEIAQPLLEQPGSTVADWEMIELLLIRALDQIKLSPLTNLENAIKGMLSAMMPIRSRYRRERIDPQIREYLLLDIGRLRYQLSYTASFEQLIIKLLPQKRKLHTKLAGALNDIDLLAQSLHFSLLLKRHFSTAFGKLMEQIQTLTSSLVEESLITVEDRARVEKIKILCRDIIAKSDGPYEENKGQFYKLIRLHGTLKEIAGRHGFKRLFQPTLAEQLEERLKVQSEWLTTQVSPQIQEKGLTTKIVKLQENSMALRSWETAALAAAPAQYSSPRSVAAQEVISRGTALTSAIKDCRFVIDGTDIDPESALNYLREQLRGAARQLEWLTSRPCISHSDINLAINLRQTLKKWENHLSASQSTC